MRRHVEDGRQFDSEQIPNTPKTMEDGRRLDGEQPPKKVKLDPYPSKQKRRRVQIKFNEQLKEQTSEGQQQVRTEEEEQQEREMLSPEEFPKAVTEKQIAQRFRQGG